MCTASELFCSHAHVRSPSNILFLFGLTDVSFLEVMTEYMDDVLQPRSRHSWDVLKAWFIAAGGREITTTTATTTTSATSTTAATTAATATGSTTATAAVTTAAAAADSTTRKCAAEEGEDEEMTLVLPQDDGGDDGSDGCGHGDIAKEERTPREARRETENATAGVSEPPNALEKDGAVVAAAPSPVDAEVAATRPPPTTTTTAAISNAEEGVRETESTAAAAAAASEPPNGVEKDGAVVAAAPSPVDADGTTTPTLPTTTTAISSVSVADGDGDSDMASPTRPRPAADNSLEAARGAPPSDSGGGDGGGGDAGGACGDWVVSECKVADDGSCGSCGEVLRSIDLSEDDEERMLKQVGTSVVEFFDFVLLFLWQLQPRLFFFTCVLSVVCGCDRLFVYVWKYCIYK